MLDISWKYFPSAVAVDAPFKPVFLQNVPRRFSTRGILQRTWILRSLAKDLLEGCLSYPGGSKDPMFLPG